MESGDFGGDRLGDAVTSLTKNAAAVGIAFRAYLRPPASAARIARLTDALEGATSISHSAFLRASDGATLTVQGTSEMDIRFLDIFDCDRVIEASRAARALDAAVNSAYAPSRLVHFADIPDGVVLLMDPDRAAVAANECAVVPVDHDQVDAWHDGFAPVATSFGDWLAFVFASVLASGDFGAYRV